MSDATIQAIPAKHDVALGGDVVDYAALLKPRVMFLVVFTALVGLVAAPGTMHPVLAIAALACIAVGAGASGALNMWYDADIDARMARTASRPVPQGAVSPDGALAFGTVLAIGSVLCLGLMANWVAASLLAATIGFYVVVYTMWLKRSTPQNIVIGGAAGAMPPVLGWTAVTGVLDPQSLLLFLIIFAWTPPHFWALAIHRCNDYARADVPMLPVTHGIEYTRLQILFYTVLLVLVSLLPYVTHMSGLLYLLAAVILGGVFLYYAINLFRGRDDGLPMRTFIFSIYYLMGLFSALLLDHYVLLLW